MIQEVRIKTIEDLQKFAFEQKYNDTIDRYRSSYFYRGMCRENYELKTSLSRNCGEHAQALEQILLENYIKYVSIEDPTVNESIWKAMIIGQHHGLPTRLLDWTHSTLVALHFAMTEYNYTEMDQHDCAVWRIDARELNHMLPDKYQKALEAKKTFIFSMKNLESIVQTIDEYDADMAGKSFITIEPPSIDQRIVNQYSFFTMIPSGIQNLNEFLNERTTHTIKYIIDKSLRWQMRDILDQWNINERMIYPGKDGIATWLARHYYVRKNCEDA